MSLKVNNIVHLIRQLRLLMSIGIDRDNQKEIRRQKIRLLREIVKEINNV